MTGSGRFDVAGLGQCAYDILGRLDSYPPLDQKAELKDVLLQGGGPVATALVTLARLGVSTAFAGCVGDDYFGREIRSGLTGEGVDCSHLLVEADAISQVAFIAIDDDGHRNIFWHRGTAGPLHAENVDPDLFARVRVLHLDGLQHAASMAAARLARDAGVMTVLDGGSVRDGTEELLPLIDHLVVSEKFARQLAGEVPPERALQHLQLYGAEAVTVTCGERGSWSIERGGEPFYQPAFEVEVVDTTGCGDVFHGGYIYGLLQGWSLSRRVEFAAAAAALKTRALGGRTAIPTINDIEKILNKSLNK